MPFLSDIVILQTEILLNCTMKIQLSDHFNYKKLILFTLPSMLMMIASSIYCMVDGYCVSNFIGKEALAAVNLIMPFPVICSTIGMMLGTGGSALIARTLGKQGQERANKLFSMVVSVSIIVGLLISIIGFIFIPDISLLLGANDSLLPYCITYGRIFMLALVPFTLEGLFQTLLITAEKPNLGLIFVVVSGVCNISLDFLFLGYYDCGIEGAAWATLISSMIGGVGPLIYFLLPQNSLLHLTSPMFDCKALIEICWNGSSEMINNVSGSVCAILYNLQLMKLIGEDGVAAYGVIMYVNFIFLSIFGGYMMGLESIVAYHYGAENHDEVKNLRRRSILLTCLFGIVMFIFAEICAPFFVKTFVGYDALLSEISTHAFRLYAIAFLVMGFNGLTSSFFTALGNGKLSATISFCRTFVFEISSVIFLPLIIGIDGVWLSLTVAECCCLLVSWYFYQKYKKQNIY